jgi:hypothetical protein
MEINNKEIIDYINNKIKESDEEAADSYEYIKE